MGVKIMTSTILCGITNTSVQSKCIYTETEATHEFSSVVLVTAQLPRNDLYEALQEKSADWAEAGIKSVTLIGDAEAPGIIASAVWSGHRFARDLGEPETDGVPFKRELNEILPD